MAQTANSVSQYGITWEFDGEYAVGQYANGDWWVEGPVTITKITPESTVENGRVKHGTMLDPGGGPQGYDSHESDLTYDSTLNVDPGATGGNLVVDEGSVVSAISKTNPDDSGRPLVSDLAILTVVTAEPADDAFRPDPYRDSKAHAWRESDLDESILRNLPVTDAIATHLPDLQEARDEMLRFWNEHDTSWKQRAVHAENNQPTYGYDIAKRVGQIFLLLHLDIGAQIKRDLFVGLVQYGLDNYARVQTGGDWNPNGGINPGRKPPVLLAGLALNDPNLLTVADREEDRARFQEDGQTFFVTEDDVGKEVWDGKETYREEDVGMPEWGIRHWTNTARDDRPWAVSYSWVGSSFVPSALAAHLTDGAVEGWNHPAFFAYADRYEQRGSPGEGNNIGEFAQACWDAYRYVDRTDVGDADHQLQFSTVAVDDNRVYVAGLGQGVQALPRNGGGTVWTFSREGALSDSSPVLDEQRGQLYVGGGGGNLSAIDTETGDEVWVVETDSAITSTPRLDGGTIYVGTNDGLLLKIDADAGTKTAETGVGGAIYGQPAVDTDRVYVLTSEGTLSARSREDLGETWERETGGDVVHSSPTVANGSVYAATDAVYAFDASNGNLAWQQAYAGNAGSSPLVQDGVLSVGDANGTIHAMDVTDSGTTLWTTDSWRAVATDPVLDSDSESLLVGSIGGTVHSIAADTGDRKHTTPVGQRLRGLPPIDNDEMYTEVGQLLRGRLVIDGGNLFIPVDGDGVGEVVQIDLPLNDVPGPLIESVDGTIEQGETVTVDGFWTAKRDGQLYYLDGNPDNLDEVAPGWTDAGGYVQDNETAYRFSDERSFTSNGVSLKGISSGLDENGAGLANPWLYFENIGLEKRYDEIFYSAQLYLDTDQFRQTDDKYQLKSMRMMAQDEFHEGLGVATYYSWQEETATEPDGHLEPRVYAKNYRVTNNADGPVQRNEWLGRTDSDGSFSGELDFPEDLDPESQFKGPEDLSIVVDQYGEDRTVFGADSDGNLSDGDGNTGSVDLDSGSVELSGAPPDTPVHEMYDRRVEYRPLSQSWHRTVLWGRIDGTNETIDRRLARLIHNDRNEQYGRAQLGWNPEFGRTDWHHPPSEESIVDYTDSWVPRDDYEWEITSENDDASDGWLAVNLPFYTTSAQDIDVYADAVYINDSAERVEIGDRPVMEACGKLVVQEQLHRTNSRIEFSLETGNLDRTDDWYLFVVNEDGEYSDPVKIHDGSA